MVGCLISLRVTACVPLLPSSLYPSLTFIPHHCLIPLLPYTLLLLSLPPFYLFLPHTLLHYSFSPPLPPLPSAVYICRRR